MVEAIAVKEVEVGESKEAFYRRIGVIPEGSTFLSSEYVDMHDPQRIRTPEDAWMRVGAESYYAVERVRWNDTSGKEKVKYIAQKAIIAGSWGVSLHETAKRLVDRLQLLSQHGVPTPHVYAIEKATIFRDFIPRDDVAHVKKTLERSSFLDEHSPQFAQAKNWVENLDHIAYALDSMGFTPLHFFEDMVHDPGTDTFYYVDAGFDLGEPHPTNLTPGRKGASWGQLHRLISGNSTLTKILEAQYRPVREKVAE